MKYQLKEEYLPIKLIEQLTNINLKNNDYRTTNNFLKCVAILDHKQIKDYFGLYNYIPVGSNYWKTVFSRDYYPKVIKPLLENNIIQSHDFNCRTFPNKKVKSSIDHTPKEVSTRYRINPNLMVGECKIIKYNIKGKVVTSEEVIYNDGQGFTIGSNNDMDKSFRVNILRDEAIAFIDANTESICKGYLKPDYFDQLKDSQIINYNEYQDYLGGRSLKLHYSTVGQAKRNAEEKGKQIFYFKDQIYMADIALFLEHRIEAMKYRYNREISKVGSLPIIDRRSETTLRVYNYLTNFPAKILPYITINNRTIFQSDLKSSQFLLFANILNVYIQKGEGELLNLFKSGLTQKYLKKLFKVLKDHSQLLPTVGVDINNPELSKYSNSNVIEFIRDVFFSDFYTIVQHELGLSERSMAKQKLFKLLFKMDDRYDESLEKIKDHYPTAISVIANFKKKETKGRLDPKANKKHNDKAKTKINDKLKREQDLERNFSVFMQCIESEIFIDNILIPLRKLRIPCFTRHDSICVQSGYEDQVEIFVKEVFAKFGFRYNHKDEDMFWSVADQDEMDISGYSDFIDGEDLLTYNYEIEGRYADNPISKTLELEETCDVDELLDDEHMEILQRLLHFGIREDYYDLVSLEFLEELSGLPVLSRAEMNYLENDVINIGRDGMNFFQPETNDILRDLIDRYQNTMYQGN